MKRIKEQNYKQSFGELTLEELHQKIEDNFSSSNNVVYMQENTDTFKCGMSLDDLKIDDKLLALKVFDKTKELRLELIDGKYSYRLLEDLETGSKGYVREIQYIIRKNTKASEVFISSGKKYFIYHEYFKLDDKTNMPIKFDERLCGLEG